MEPGGDALPLILAMIDEGGAIAPEHAPVTFETDEARDIAAIFWQLHAARGSNGFGVNPLSFVELDAYQRLTGTPLTPWLTEQIRLLDSLFFAALGRVTRTDDKNNG